MYCFLSSSVFGDKMFNNEDFNIDKLKDMGFKVIIYSNATKKRIEPFKKYLYLNLYPKGVILNTFLYDVG